MLPWRPPRFREIKMDAEIGSYQADDGDVDRAFASVRETETSPAYEIENDDRQHRGRSDRGVATT